MSAVHRLAVIGAGHWGPNLIRNFHDSERSEVAWVVDRDANRLAQVSSRFPSVRTSADTDDVMADEAVDAVVVATPTTTHHPIVRDALNASKHVLVEKPIADSTENALELCRIAEERELVLMVGHVFLFNGAVEQVKHYIEDGTVGTVYYVSMVRTNLGPIRMDVNAAWDLAAHDISIASYWLDADPLAASAIGGTWINPGIEDAMFATLRYPGDVLVNIHVSWLNPRKARDITIVGDRKMLTMDDMNLSEPVRVYDKHVTQERVQPSFVDTFASFRSSVREGAITIPKVVLGEPLKAECEHFLDCLDEGTRPKTDGWRGLSVVGALEAIERSARDRGREVEITTTGDRL